MPPLPAPTTRKSKWVLSLPEEEEALRRERRTRSLGIRETCFCVMVGKGGGGGDVIGG